MEELRREAPGLFAELECKLLETMIQDDRSHQLASHMNQATEQVSRLLYGLGAGAQQVEHEHLVADTAELHESSMLSSPSDRVQPKAGVRQYEASYDGNVDNVANVCAPQSRIWEPTPIEERRIPTNTSDKYLAIMRQYLGIPLVGDSRIFAPCQDVKTRANIHVRAPIRQVVPVPAPRRSVIKRSFGGMVVPRPRPRTDINQIGHIRTTRGYKTIPTRRLGMHENLGSRFA